MYRVLPPGRSSRVRTLLIAVALLGLLGAVVPMATGYVGPASAPRSIAPIGSAAHAVTPRAVPLAHVPARTVTPTPSAPKPAPHPAAANGSGLFWIANDSFSSVSFINNSCYFYTFTGYFDSTCYNQAVSPTLMNLSNGDVGLSFDIYTNRSYTNCGGAYTNVRERVAYAVSSNSGESFGSYVNIGNNTCTYLDAIEPSFAVGPNGTIYGVFVEENYSDNQGYYTSRTVGSGCYYYYYYYRCFYGDGNDAIGFVESTDNGTSFSKPITIASGGNISKPQLVVDGQSLYVLYENDSNGTASLQYGAYGYNTGAPISEQLLYSNNSGATWTGPLILPGENAAADYTTLGGAIAVNSAGLLGAAYFTNHRCIANASYYTCWDSGDDLVYTTSSTNGTTWSPLVTVQTNVGESYEWADGFYMDAFFQVVPQAALTFDSAGANAFITWSGTYNNSLLTTAPYNVYDTWTNSGIFAAVGPVSGASFTVTSVQVGLSYADRDSSFNPSIAESSGTIYLAYTTANETYCYNCGNPLDGSYIENLQTSTNGGVSWTSPTILSYSDDCYYSYCTTNYASSSFPGFSSSIGFTASAQPLVAYALPYGFQYTYEYYGGTSYYNYSYATHLFVASVWSGPTVNVNFTENGIAAGKTWTFSLNGNSFSTTQSSFIVTNVPLGQTMDIIPGTVAQSEWGVVSTPVLSVPALTSFSANVTVFINYTSDYLLQLSIEPTNTNYAEIDFDYGSDYYYYEVYNDCPFYCYQNTYQSSYSWYFPQNTSLHLDSYADFPQESLDYWTGIGNGSYTGGGSQANLTINQPINETGWEGGFGVYNLSVGTTDLPVGSTFYFELDGVQHSGTAGSIVNVTNVGTGAHEITNVWATSSTAGWEYFGQPAPANPVLIPAETSVSLVFALVDVAASVGTVTFQANGLTNGTVWTLEFNGTIYSSSTPWINVTTHPGTFPIGGFPVVAQNGSEGYTPSGVGPTISVLTGSSYDINFVPAYKVEVLAGTGGSVQGGQGAFWVAAGGSASYVAVAKTGYGFGGWSGTGLGSYTGPSSYANITANGPIVQTASFYALPNSRFNLTFVEAGLAPGTWWTVFLGASGYSTNNATLEIGDLLACGAPGGNYNLTVPYAYASNELTRYLPTSHLAKAVCTTGDTVLNEVFVAQYWLTLQSTAGGFAEAQVGSNLAATSLWVASGSSVTLTAVAQTGYDFLGWNGTGPGNFTGASLAQTILMAGPITELATFVLHVAPPPPTFSVTFKEQQTLSPGTVWSISFAGNGYSSTSATLTVSGLTAGNYPLSVNTALSPAGTTRYSSLGNTASVSVTHNITDEPITFSTSYWVSVSGTAGGTTTPGSNWVTSGTAITLNVSVYAGYNFVWWTGNGSSSYTGDAAPTTITVSSPISEVATFEPVGKTITTGAAGSTLWSSPSTWIGLGLVGLIIGLVVGLVVSRRGGRQPPAPAPYEGPASDGAGGPDAGNPTAPEGGTP
jgi:List-Bact-rpt repeat protein